MGPILSAADSELPSQNCRSPGVQELSKNLDTVKTPAEAKAVIIEMQEFNHRVTLVGQQLFSRQSAGLAACVARVREAKSGVDAAIRKIGKVSSALSVISDFLALADEAIDLAKAVG